MVGNFHRIVMGKCGLILRRSHIGEAEAFKLMNRISSLTDCVADFAVFGLTRRLQDRAVHIEDHRAAMPVPQVEPRPHHAAVG